jgi:uncharacterized membrane protein
MSSSIPGDALTFAWERVKADPGTILATIVVGTVIMFIVQFVTSFAATLIAGAAGSAASMASRHGDPLVGFGVVGPLYYLARGVGQLVNIIVSSFFVAGVYGFSLKVARGQAYAFNDLLSGMPVFVPLVIANILTDIAVVIGLVFLVVPGVIIALGLSMTMPLIVDKRLGPIDALSASWTLTTGNKGMLFIFALLSIALVVAGMCACVVGVLLVIPILCIAHAYVYLRLSGQPVARAAPAV